VLILDDLGTGSLKEAQRHDWSCNSSAPLRKLSADGDDPAADAPPKHVRIAWCELMRRTFDDPLICPRCHGRMRLVAVIKDPNAIAAILAHPHHRDDDPDIGGPDPPQLSLDLTAA